MGLDKEKGEGELKNGFVFHAVLFCYCFLAYLFQCRLIDFLSRSSKLLDGLLLQYFSSSHPNLVITFLLCNYCESQLYQIVVFSIGTRQGCKLFKVVPPHLILIARSCICIIIGSLGRVIDALRQVD